MHPQGLGKQNRWIVLLFCAYAFASVVVLVATREFIHVAMVWNLLLAILPFAFSQLLIGAFEKSRKIASVALGLMWLLLFPNAPYLMTDFIHISGTAYWSRAGEYGAVFYSRDILAWVKLVHIGFGVLFGTLIGLLSLYHLHVKLSKLKGQFIANTALVLVCALSGFGIFLGRFLRLNSWDILRPFELLSRAVTSINAFSVSFSVLFAVYILASYCIFWVVHHRN